MSKKIMRAFKINEISAVDQPAQQGAKAVLMKRHDDSIEDEDLVVEKKAALTTSEEGHAHIIYCLEESGGTTSYSKMPGDDKEMCGHSHPYIVTDEGKVIIGEAEGHTHTVEAFGKEAPKKKENGKEFGAGDYAYVPDTQKPSSWKLRLTNTPGGSPDPRIVGAAVAALGEGFRGNKVEIPSEDRSAVISRVRRAWLDANPDKTKDDLPSVLKSNQKENTMDPKEIEALKKSHTDELAKKDAELAKANKLAALSDVEKAHYNTLADDAAKDAFLAKSADDRKAVLAKAAEADPVVYKSVAGIEYRKSAGETVIALAKQNDELAKGIAVEKAARENAELEKRASDEFKNLPGTLTEKAALLKSLESIPDEATRKAAIAAVKAGDTAIASAFTRKGAGGGSSESSSASDQLDTLAKKYASDNKTDYSKAYQAVIKTDEGKKLYEQTVLN